VSVLSLGEIRKGIERARSADHAKASILEQWLRGLATSFANRIIPINTAVADEWGRISAVRPIPPVDALLAASAIVFDQTLVSRNTHDIQDTGVRFINPFSS
jgi:predicted nucleic acid-binding protein